MTTSDDRIQGWVDGVLDRTRDRLRTDLTQLVADLTERMAAQQADAAVAARRDAEAAAAALASEAMEAERQAAQERLTEAVAAARREAAAEQEEQTFAAAHVAEREANLADASALVDAFRALDAATSLSDVLDEVVRRAARHTSRVAILLRQDDRLHGWAWTGFGDGDARAFSTTLAEAGAAGRAVETGEQQTVAGLQDGAGTFAPSRDDRAGLAVPLKIGGDVVGVLYADNEGDAPDVVPSAWPELVEALARHAQRCLETITVRGLPDLLRAGAAERARRQTERHDDEAAQRYARLLVAEIRLYNESLVDEARRERNVLRKLRPQIERAHQLYDERVSADIRARTRYFEQELLRTLADGDPALLGQPT